MDENEINSKLGKEEAEANGVMLCDGKDCGKEIKGKVKDFMIDNPDAFEGKNLCFKCQQKFKKERAFHNKEKKKFGEAIVEGHKDLKSLEYARKVLGEADVVQLFGDSRIGKSKFALQLAKDVLMHKEKVLYIDTEKNLSDDDRLMLGENYVVCLDTLALKNLVDDIPDDIDIVILDSIGMPVLISFSEMGMKDRGEALLMLTAIMGKLKKWCYRTGGWCLITNQMKSEMAAMGGFGKSKNMDDIPPFGDKSKYIAKSIIKMYNLSKSEDETYSQIRAWGCRDLGKGTVIADVFITKEGVKIDWNMELLKESE